MSEPDDFGRTISFGENALLHLKRNRIPAYPRHYELWYTYAAGFNEPLNRSVNDILRIRGQISVDEMQHIYNAFLSPSRLGVRIEEVGGRVAQEIGELANRLNEALGAASSYDQSLRSAAEDLEGSKDRQDVRGVIHRLLAATHELRSGTAGSRRAAPRVKIRTAEPPGQP